MFCPDPRGKKEKKGDGCWNNGREYVDEERVVLMFRNSLRLYVVRFARGKLECQRRRRTSDLTFAPADSIFSKDKHRSVSVLSVDTIKCDLSNGFDGYVAS